MKKLLSLLMAILTALSVIAATPTVFAEELDYSLISQSFGKQFWKDFAWKSNEKTASGVVKVDEWYYQYSKNKETEKITLSVCGYEGIETEIEIPIELAGIGITHLNEFYLFSATVKTVNIPKEITSINSDLPGEYIDTSMEGGHPYDYCPPIIECADGQLEAIVVANDNPRFSSLDGVLFTKNKVRLLYYPHGKADEEYVVPDTVSFITGGAFAKAGKLKSLTITPNVQELGYNSIPQKGLDELRYENARLPDYVLYYVDGEDDVDHSYPMYLPDVPDTVVYCVKNSDLYKEYKESFEEPEAMCKELKTLTLDTTPTLKKGDDGKWYYYEGKYNAKKYTLVKYEGKWFYVTNGVWDKEVSNIMCGYKNKWFYIKNGKWDKTANGFIRVSRSGEFHEWAYFVNGKKYDKPKDLVKYNGKWFYVVNGYWYGLYGYAEWDQPSNINTLFKKNGKWFAIVKGKWYKGETIIKYLDKKFYVNKGFVQFKYSGKVKIDGKTYKIKNGKVV